MRSGYFRRKQSTWLQEVKERGEVKYVDGDLIWANKYSSLLVFIFFARSLFVSILVCLFV